MDYIKPFGVTTSGRPSYVNGNPAAGIKGSIPDVAVWEYPMREIIAAEEAAGLTPSNGDLTQLAQAIQRNIPIGTAGGSANAITTVLSPAPATWAGLRLFMVRITASNTGAATIAPSGLSARAIKRNDGTTDVAANDLVAGGMALFLNDGTNIQLIAMWTAATVLPDSAIWHYCAAPAGGTANALTASCLPAITSLVNGANFLVTPSVNNTGTATMAMQGLGALPIVNRDGSALSAGQLASGQMAWLVYLSGINAFVLMNPVQSVFAPNVVKAWVNFDATGGSVVITGSYNVSSVTKTATGRYIINFATALPTSAYSVVGMSSESTGGTGGIMAYDETQTANVNNVAVANGNAAVPYIDCKVNSVIIF